MGRSMNSAMRSLILLALIAGCGDDDSRSTYSSGLPKDREASTLDDDDKEQFCRTVDTHFSVSVGLDEVARLTCLPVALLTATSRDDCEDILDSCSSNAAQLSIERMEREDQCVDSLASCNEDIGTLETCVNVNIKAVRAVLENFTCARFGDSDLERDLDDAMTAESCAKTSSSCQDAVLLL